MGAADSPWAAAAPRASARRRGAPGHRCDRASAVGSATKALSDIKICRISLTHPDKPRQRTMNALLEGLSVTELDYEAFTLPSQQVAERVRQEATLFRLMTCPSKLWLRKILFWHLAGDGSPASSSRPSSSSATTTATTSETAAMTVRVNKTMETPASELGLGGRRSGTFAK